MSKLEPINLNVLVSGCDKNLCEVLKKSDKNEITKNYKMDI